MIDEHRTKLTLHTHVGLVGWGASSSPETHSPWAHWGGAAYLHSGAQKSRSQGTKWQALSIP